MNRPKQMSQLDPKYVGAAILGEHGRRAIWDYIVWLEKKAGDYANQKPCHNTQEEG
jgi:hypothetical protein